MHYLLRWQSRATGGVWWEAPWGLEGNPWDNHRPRGCHLHCSVTNTSHSEHTDTAYTGSDLNIPRCPRACIVAFCGTLSLCNALVVTITDQGQIFDFFISILQCMTTEIFSVCSNANQELTESRNALRKQQWTLSGSFMVCFPRAFVDSSCSRFIQQLVWDVHMINILVTRFGVPLPRRNLSFNSLTCLSALKNAKWITVAYHVMLHEIMSKTKTLYQ